MSAYFLAAAVLAGFYMAWNIGANDSANSMATAVGAKAITFRQAVLIAGVLEFAGAYLVGSHVTGTIKSGVVSPANFASVNVFALALLSAIVGAATWVFIATWKELPVSTTHSIVGALVGVGLVSGGMKVVAWNKVVQIVLSWVISPVFSGVLAFIIFRAIAAYFLVPEDRERRMKKFFPFFIFITFFIMTVSFLFKTPLGMSLHFSTAGFVFLSFMFPASLALIFSVIIVKKLHSFHPEKVFRILQIFTSCYVAFAHGANDVANAIGPLAGIFSIYRTGAIASKAGVGSSMLLLGGIGISVGIFTWGYKVIKTVGGGITALTNSRGFSIDFATATAVLAASKLGLPVSTTHAAVGAVLGIGLARGLEAIDLRVVRNIVYAWVITLPAAAALSVLIFILIR